MLHCIISPAKTFAKKGGGQPTTKPIFFAESLPIVEQALRMTTEDYAKGMKLSPKMASEARTMWQAFAEGTSPEAASLLMYSGMVFKKIDAKSWSSEDWACAENHVSICSFVYGLLSPSSAIRPYRMEGTVQLEDGKRVFDYWKDKLTAELIRRVQASGGTLIYLASEEMKQLFHWAEVERSVRVIYFDFWTRQADGSLKSIVIYCKMARGAMLRAIIKGQIEDAEALKALSPEGFVYAPTLSQENNWSYILG